MPHGPVLLELGGCKSGSLSVAPREKAREFFSSLFFSPQVGLHFQSPFILEQRRIQGRESMRINLLNHTHADPEV
jgi:hypothetical protein